MVVASEAEAMHSLDPVGAGGSEVEAMRPLDPILAGEAADAPGRTARLAERLQRHPGMKYVVAAFALVALVLLLVVASLRPDVAKRPVEVVPSRAVAVPDEAKDPLGEAKAEQASEEHRAGVRMGDGARRGSRVRSVGPPVERRAQVKPVALAAADQARPNPFGENGATVSQDQIGAVVRNKNNQAALKSCYERALKLDEHLTSGRMDVSVSIAPSGTVERVTVDAPSNFFMVESCIKLAVKRWTFPPSSEQYGTTFPLIMQGGM
jgi:hypothetical protein